MLIGKPCHAHNIEYYGLVKVVNNANGRRLAAVQQQKQIYRLCKVRAGYVLCRALVIHM